MSTISASSIGASINFRRAAIFLFCLSAVFTGCSGTRSQAPEALPGAESALENLLAGNKRYQSGEASLALKDKAKRTALVKGQKPEAIVFSCSDSRVPPEVVFDKGLGELFVIRTAGEVPDSAAVASIEYAIEHLKTPLLIVMGHQSCGAVSAALNTPEGSSAGSKDLDILVKAIRPNLGSKEEALKDPTLSSAVRSQVKGVASDLAQRSAIIGHAIKTGELRVMTAMYKLDTGEVEFFE